MKVWWQQQQNRQLSLRDGSTVKTSADNRRRQRRRRCNSSPCTVQSTDSSFHDSPPLPLSQTPREDSCATHGISTTTTNIVSLGTGSFTLQGFVDTLTMASRNTSSQDGCAVAETHISATMSMMTTTTSTRLVLLEEEGGVGVDDDLHKSPTEQTSSDDEEDDEETRLNLLEQTLQQHLASSSFVRVCDLNLQLHNHHSNLRSSVTTVCPHNEHQGEWMAIPSNTNHDSNNATTTETITRPLMDALATMALSTLLNTTLWTPDGKTKHILTCSDKSWEGTTFCPPSDSAVSDTSRTIPDSATDSSITTTTDHVLVWTGTLVNSYGSDIPAVRSSAIMTMSAESLLDLLMDSSRVKEYNAMSLGRTDIQVLESSNTTSMSSISLETMFPRTVATKIVQSASRPPMLRKTLQFTTLLHAREYIDGYLLVSRAVTLPNDTSSTSNNTAVVVSEILLGVNWIRRINDQQCLLVTVNHVKSPLIPLMLAKRLGLQAAVNFIHDVRASCKTNSA
jgi:hypothetical protein